MPINSTMRTNGAVFKEIANYQKRPKNKYKSQINEQLLKKFSKLSSESL